MSVRGVMALLKEQKILNDFQTKAFFIWVKLNNVEKNLKAGTYILQGKLSLNQIMNILVSGKEAQFELMVIEGDTVADFKAQLVKHPAILKTIGSMSDKALAKLLGSSYENLEGVLFPDTYHFPKNTPDTIILKLSYDTMQKHLNKAWDNRAKHLAVKTPYEALILASIIEKESKVAEERAIISGVFHRRLEKNMRLQADPTVRYGMPAEAEKITRKDLRTKHPYNTYVHKGLPPTPIALPGLASIQAALHPDRSELLYFVAKGDGSHYFSEDLKEHNLAVKKYQLKQKIEEGGLIE
tara:strand:- start:226674 stop:227564 length:891 start_codon:yes stop_codon:yes gene_type:complete